MNLEDFAGAPAGDNSAYAPMTPVFGEGLGDYLFNDGYYEWSEQELVK